MSELDYKDAVLAFGNYHSFLPIAEQEFSDFTITPLSGGLINHTYKVESPLSVPFLLQQINQKVFNNPADVQANYMNLWQYAEFEFTGLRLPSPKYYNKTSALFIDQHGQYWRAFEFIENSTSVAVASNPAQARAVAKTFAEFTAAFKEMNVNMLKTVIPDFHNLSVRYQQFKDSLNSELYERMAKALSMIDELEERERYKHFYELFAESQEFPKRVMHHDAKIGNVLFSKKTGKVICAVDFDTVMPGYFFSDLGDMIRSMVCSVDENSILLDKIKIRKTFYDSIISGYLMEMSNQLTDSEKKHIHHAGLLMIYMQALRFLTDYLNGDVYYKTNYPEHNFDRAKNQLTLLQSLEAFLQKHYNYKI